MTLRVCNVPGCPEYIGKGARGGKCPEHAREYSRSRGSATARGYDYQHTCLSRQARAAVNGEPCHFCGKPMWSDQDLALDHDPTDLSKYRGVTHAGCNASDGAKRSNSAR